jgi:CRP-like cAMP-binding protein
MEKKPQGTIIFRYGNKGTRFYIVLGGEVSVLLLRETKVEMTFLNYVRYLLLLKVLKEDELAKKIISANPKSTFRISEKDIDIYYDNIISFINKYYNIVTLNESDIIENSKNESNNKNNKENYELEDPKGLYDFNNNLIFESIKNKKIAKKYTLEGESKLKSSLQKLKAKKSLLLNLDDKKENQNSFSDKSSENSKNKESSEKNPDNIKLVKFVNIKKSDEDSKEKDISKEEKPLGIKYKATKKIPNYLELDICTFGPSDISKLVNFVIKGLEVFYSKINNVHNVEEYIRNCAVHPSLKYCDKYSKKEKLTVFQYFEITKKKEGDTFGELALQHNDNKRTGTMIATKDLVLGYLSKNDYNNCLRGVEMKKRKIEANFIMSFSLFDEMNWVNFEKTYFNFLKKENLTSGQIIINQNEKAEKIYFIMEGQIEITTN